MRSSLYSKLTGNRRGRDWAAIEDENRELREESRRRLSYVATMLRGDTDRIQIAQYIENDLLGGSPEQGD